MKMENIESRGKTLPESPPSPPADPVFASAHAALKFALNFSHGTLKKGFMAQSPGSGRGLAGLDGAAQAGMILAELGEMTELYGQVIVARFAVPVRRCICERACCRGIREAEAWGEAIDFVSEYALAAGLTGQISHFRLRRSLVKRYFGVKESFIDMAKACGVHRTTASEYNRAVFDHLKFVERRAFIEVEDRLRRGGVVAS